MRLLANTVRRHFQTIRVLRRGGVILGLVLIAILLAGPVISTAASLLAQATADPTTIDYGKVVTGQLSADGSQDWHFVGAPGDIAAIHLTRTSGDLVAGITIQDVSGQPIVTVQATQSGDLTLADLSIPQTNTYVIHVFSLNHTAGTYSLALTNSAGSQPTQTPITQSAAGSINYGQTVHGILDVQVYNQVWTFTGTAGDLIDVQMRLLNAGSDLSGFLTVRAANGGLVTTSSQSKPASTALTGLSTRDAAIYAAKLDTSGQYTIQASRLGVNGKPPFPVGDYLLTLTLHSAATGTPGPALTAIQLNGTVSGQLSGAQPMSQYQLPGGTLALRLALTTPHRIAYLRILDSSGAVVFERSGISPLDISATMPTTGPTIAQVFADVFDDQPTTDFALSVYQTPTVATALHPGISVRGLVDGSPNAWFFIAQAGDLVTLRAQSDPAYAAGIQTIVTAPNGSVLLQRTSGAAFDQPILLPLTGAYQVAIKPTIGGTAPTAIPANGSAGTPEAIPASSIPYILTFDRFGVNGTSFSRFAAVPPSGSLTTAQAVGGTLIAEAAPTATAAGTSGPPALPGGQPNVQTWTLDAQAGQSFNLIASVTQSTQPIGILWIAPDGTLLTGQSAQGTVLINSVVTQTAGRYTVAVFDPIDLTAVSNTSVQIPYALRITEDSGGPLISGQPVKGLLTTSDGIATWTLDVPVGDTIAAHLNAPNAADPAHSAPAFIPSLSLIAPGGEVVSRADSPDLIGYRAAIGGQYRIIVTGRLSGESAPYILRADVQPANAALTTPDQPDPPAITAAPGLIAAQPANTLITPTLPVQIGSAGNPVPVLLFDNLLRGQIPTDTTRQIWRVTAIAGNTIALQAVPLGSDQPPSMALFDTAGHLLAESLVGTHSADSNWLQYTSLHNNQFYLVVAAPSGYRYGLYAETLALNKFPLTTLTGSPIAYGQPINGEILTAGQIDTYVFYGTSNDVVNLSALRVTDNLAPSLSIQSMNGFAYGSDVNKYGGRSSALTRIRLPESTLYVIHVQAAASASTSIGRYWLDLERTGGLPNESLVGGILNPDANHETTVTGALTTSQVGSLWLFAGHAGEQVSLSAETITNRGPIVFQPLRLQLQDTAGRTIAAQDDVIGVGHAALTQITLPANGVYRVQITDGAQAQGYYRLHWSMDPTPPSTRIIQYGQQLYGTFAPGHLANQWTFAGTAGDTVALAIHTAYSEHFSLGFQVFTSTGVPLSTAADVATSGEARVDSLQLPLTGTYTIVAVDPDTSLAGASVYTLSLSLLDSKAHSFGGIVADGAATVGELYADDPIHTWLFSGRGGQVVSAQATGQDSFLTVDLSLQTTNGTTLPNAHAAATKIGGAAGISKIVLPADGVYALKVTGANHSTGSYGLNFTLDSPVIPPTVIQPGQSPIPGLIANDRLSSTFNFDGQLGDKVNLLVQRESTASLALILELRDPSGHLLARSDAYRNLGAAINGFVLPATGTYHVVVSRFNGEQGQSSGRFAVSLTLDSALPTPKGSLTAGKAALGQLGDSEPSDRWTFSGQTGQTISLTTQVRGGDLDTVLTLQSLDGHVLATSDDVNGLNAAIKGVGLPSDGLYTVTVARFGNQSQGSSGTYELRLDNLFNAAPATNPTTQPIAFGQSVIGTLDAAHTSTLWSFTSQAGALISAQFTYPADDVPMTLTLQAADQTVLAAAVPDSAQRGTPNNGHSQIAHYLIPAAGTYLLRVDRPSTTRAAFTPYTLSLSLLNPATGITYVSPTVVPRKVIATSGTLTLNQPIDATLTADQHYQRWPVHVPAGQAIRVRMVAETAGWQPVTALFGPQGQAIVESVTAQTPFGSAALLTMPIQAADQDYALLAAGIGGTPGAYWLNVDSDATAFADSPTENWVGTAFAAATPLPAGNDIESARGLLIGTVPHVWRFTAKAHTAYSVSVAFDAGFSTANGDQPPGLLILDIHGTVIGTGIASARELFVTGLTIPRDGQYLIVLTAPQGTTSVVSFTLYTAQHPPFLPGDLGNPHVIKPGITQRSVLSTGQTTEAWTFDATQLDAASVTIKRLGGNLRLDAALYNADGLVMARAADTRQDQLVLSPPLPLLPGTYTVLIARWLAGAGNSFGGYSIHLDTKAGDPVPADPPPAALTAFHTEPIGTQPVAGIFPSADVTPDTFTGGAISADQIGQWWTVTLSNSPLIALTIQAATIPLQAVLLDSTGQVLFSGQTDASGGLALQSSVGKAPGPFILQLISLMPGKAGTYNFRVSEALAPDGGGLLLADPANGVLTADHEADSWRFTVTDAQPITLTIQDTTGILALTATIFDPTGQPVPTTTIPTTSDLLQINGLPTQPGLYTVVVSSQRNKQPPATIGYTIAFGSS